MTLRLRSHYRSEMGIMGDILHACIDGGRDGICVNALGRKANLAHYAVLDKCEKLINAGLVETICIGTNRKFMITEKGLKVFDEFKNFQNLLESMELRY